MKKRTNKGWVAIVGAGPGDPGLLTLQGHLLLRQCDLVVADALVHSSILSFAPQARKVTLGKRAGGPRTSQKNIERFLIRESKKGLRIVRLKGGDPFIFGRGAEEALALRKAKIPFEIVPGVSAGHAVPAYAGIPLTHREYASQAVFVTGHEAGDKKARAVNWSVLAKFDGTIVTFMGLRQLPSIVRGLRKGGMAGNMPICVIEWGTTPKQKVVAGTLAGIERRIKLSRLSAPALAIIGKVNRLRPLLNWFEKRPLFGQRVIVTRAREQAGILIDRFKALGADVVEIPVIDVKPVPHTKEIRRILRCLKDFDFLIFTSANGVGHFWAHLEKSLLDARALAGVRVVAVGPGTAERLAARGIKADLMPALFTTAAILRMLTSRDLVKGRRFLLARTHIATKELVFGLIEAGAAIVKDLVVYRTQARHVDAGRIRDLFSNGSKPFVTFTSSSTVTHFVSAIGLRRAPFIARKARVISIGPVTTKAAREAGLKVAREAGESTIEGLVAATVRERLGRSAARRSLSGWF